MPTDPLPPEAAARIAALEAELTQTREQRDEYHRTAIALFNQLHPPEPLSEAEIAEIKAIEAGERPNGTDAILAIIAEMERDAAGQPS